MKKKTLTGDTQKITPAPLREPAPSAACAAVPSGDSSHVRATSAAHDGCISTSIPDQHAFILKALRAGPKTSYELRRGGSYQPPTRIFELRELGFNIETTRVSVTDRDGFTHVGVARYELIAEPGGSAS